MNKIFKIKITKEYRTIPLNFTLELNQMTVITGKNNSGKTNFIEAIRNKSSVVFLDKDDKKIIPKIVYIAAENIKPSDSECKPSAASTGLINNLSELFSNLKIIFEIKNKAKIFEEIENLEKKTNKNIESLMGKDNHKLKIYIDKDELSPKIIIQAIVDKITASDDYDQKEERKLEELGQGPQRIIVAAILKAYIDILIEKESLTEEPILIIFEEPEIYLHPELKRTLNATLEKIAEQDNHQIIITTHDPYFAFLNYEGDEKTIFSFKKEKGVTQQPYTKNEIDGIEDELLFIFLYNLLEKKKRIGEVKLKIKNRKYYDRGEPKERSSFLEYVRDQIHHKGSNDFTLGLVETKTSEEILKDKNYYTQEELEKVIKEMSRVLGQ